MNEEKTPYQEKSIKIPAAYVTSIMHIIHNGDLPYTGTSEFVRTAIRDYLKLHDEEGNLR